MEVVKKFNNGSVIITDGNNEWLIPGSPGKAVDLTDATPNQVESLANDSELPNSPEWKSGDKCQHKNGVEFTFVGKCNARSGHDCVLMSDSDVPVLSFINEISKPESPEQKAERERLEAAYDLYIAGQESLGVNDYRSFQQFTSDKVQVRFWLGVAGTAGYRKDKA